MTYFGTRLSENISRREPEGYLICLNVPVARTGTQEYLPSELGLPGPDNRLVPVYRPESEVFSPECIASFEGMPVTDDHPSAPDGVTAENSRWLHRGHAQHVRRGTGGESDLLLADLMIHDPALIEEILGGKREISCGYTYTLCKEDGRYVQREIRGNHVAVVDSGRAGPRVSIRDAERRDGLFCSAEQGDDLFRSAGSHSPRLPGPAPGARFLRPPGAPAPRQPAPCTHDQTERSNLMKKKSLWRAKLMARMAKDGDVDGLAELITEMMEEPAVLPAAVPAEAPAADPLVEAVAGAVAENLDPVPAAGGVLPTAAAVPAPAASPAPVVVETPTEQPVVIDCGPEILEALRQIIALLSGPAADCNTPATENNCDGDPDPSAAEEAAARTAAEAVAENLAEAAVQAVAGVLDPGLESTVDEGDPVEELVAEILETGEAGEAGSPAGDPSEVPAGSAAGEEILSSILEPVDGEDEDDPEDPAQAADALRAALASFRPQLMKMAPRERQRFNADVAARMKKLTRRQAAKSGKPGAYASLRRTADRDDSGRSLGRKIMAGRNANMR